MPDNFFQEGIEEIQIFQKLKVHIEYFISFYMVSSHFIEHLLTAQHKADNVQNSKPMCYNLH